MDRLIKTLNVLTKNRGTKSEGKQTCERMKHGDDDRSRYLLNRRQCKDLTNKLTEIHKNIQSLVEGSKLPDQHLAPALEDFYRCSEKATMLLRNCGERAWWRAAIFQWRNENAFREILLELSLRYHLLYELTYKREILQSVFEALAHDLRKSAMFEPARVDDVRKDEEDLSSLLEKLVSDHESIGSEYCPTPKELPLAQSLARYVLLKMQWASEQSLASQMEKCRAIMWDMEGEHPGTWGKASFIPGAGSSHVSGWKLTWHDIHCFKKQFHGEGEGLEKMFMKEAAIMAHLKHPNIIQFLCWGKEKKSRFIAMELMEKSLFRLIEDQRGVPFSLDVTIDIIWQMARGMCYLHDQGIAHRDLKPHNVMVNELSSMHCEGYWHVKLIDYGSSKTEVEIEQSNSITQFGIGTGVYRAPEVLKPKGWKSRGRAMWIKADVFSFGMTCAHVLTLQKPFEDMEYYSLEHLYDEVMNGKRPSFPTNCPKELYALLRGCWNIIPSKRPTFVDICSRLESLKHRMRRPTIGNEDPQLSIGTVYNKIEEESCYLKSLPKVIFAQVNDEDENKPSDLVSVIPCTCNQSLNFLEKSPYEGLPTCDICGEFIDGGVYHCSTCQFDAHPHCAEIREKVCVFFHDHTLQLLTQNYCKSNPKARCCFCDESIQDSEWVYRCEGCDYDVHAVCTKFQNNKMWENHEHPLTVRLCPPSKSSLCGRCNGEIGERSWHYFCGPCAFSMHLSCAIRPSNPNCVIEESHRLNFVFRPRIYDCAICRAQGHSQFYRCNQCEIDIHPDCVEYMDDKAYNLDVAYKKVLMEIESKDINAQTALIGVVLDEFSPFHGSESRLSTQRLRSVVKEVHAPLHGLQTSKQSHDSLDSTKDVSQQKRMISIQTAKRIKAKKLASSKLRGDPLEMLENLEKIVSNLRSIETPCEDEKKNFIALHKSLKKQQELVKEEKAIEEESKVCPGPRIGVFFQKVMKDGRVVRQLLIDLEAGMKDVSFGLLCEKPGHEHIVPGKTKIWLRELREENAEYSKPLLACGLQIVRDNITSREDDLARLESISRPNLVADFIWDLSAINTIKGMENIEVLKQGAVFSSEWFLKKYEMSGTNFTKAFGLHRIRYKVTDEGSPPCYKNGSLAWLCENHLNDGLKEGILESCSSKYHNIEDDYEIRYPPYLREV